MATKLKDVNDWRAQPSPKWPEPELRGHRIPGYRYHSEDFWKQEWENMWTKVWLLVGRAPEIPEPGDYQMEEIGPESFLMVRQQDGSIRSFYNVCQHRGARLIFNDIGTVDSFTCPYHGWRWEIDGTLTFALDPEDFPEGDPCGKLTLEEVRTEVFAGFIWINMDKDAVTLKEYLGPIWDDWNAYGFDTWKRYQAMRCRSPINWKVVLDNFNESYHLPAVHPESDTSIEENYKWTQFDLSEEGHNRMIMKAGVPSNSLKSKNVPLLREPLISTLKAWGLDPADFEGREYETREAIQKAKRERGKEKGYTHYENLRDDQLTDAYHYTIFPNFAVTAWADGFHFLRAIPHPTDPTKCVFDNWWYASQPAGETAPVFTAGGPVDRDAEVDLDVFDYGEKSLGFAIDQDMGVTAGQQLGFRSRGFNGVYLSGQERRIRRYHEIIDDYIEGRLPLKKAN